MPPVSASLSGRDGAAPDSRADAHGRDTPPGHSRGRLDRHGAPGNQETLERHALPADEETPERYALAADEETPGRYALAADEETPGRYALAADEETLERYALAGGMAPDRIRRILADLAAPLRELHRAGRAHGDIAPATIGLNPSGRARLLTPPLAPAANAEDATRRDGYAAFEQYTDDPDTPCGPWTDIYALSATACALLAGLAPPSALARCVRDDYVPLARRRGPDEQALCAVLDSGLAMDPYARPQTIDEFARALRLEPAAPAIEPAHAIKETGARAPAMAPADSMEEAGAGAPAIAPADSMEESGAGAPAIAPADAMEEAGARTPTIAPADPMEESGAGAPRMTAGRPADTAIPVAGPGERPSTLEDADGLAPIPDAAGTPAGSTGGVTLYREGGMARTQAETKPAPPATPARDPAAAQYEAAVAAVHAREDRAPRRPVHAQSHATPPRAHSGRARRPRQGAPRLLILAVCAMIAVALYVWLRPPPPPRLKSVARTSNPAASNTVASSTAASNAAASNAAASNTAASNTAVSNTATRGTAAGNTAMPGTASSNTAAPPSAAFTTGAPNTAPPAATPSATAPSAILPSTTSPSNASPASTAPSDTATMNTRSAGTLASVPAPSTATGGDGKGNGSGDSRDSAGNSSARGNSNGGNDGMSVASTSPTTPPGANPAASAVTRPTAPLTPQDAAAKPRPAAAGRTPVAVSIAVRPWGEILINGKSRGVSPPLSSLTLPPGTYDITIRNNAGPDIHQNLTITAGKTATISHTFK